MIEKWIYGNEPIENGSYLVAINTQKEPVDLYWGNGKWLNFNESQIQEDWIYAYAKMPLSPPQIVSGQSISETMAPYFIGYSNAYVNMAMVGLIVLLHDENEISFWRQSIDDEQEIERWFCQSNKEFEEIVSLIRRACAELKIPLIDKDTDRPDIS